MKNRRVGVLLPLILLLLTCTDPTQYDQEGETIYWERNADGYVRFYTDDFQNKGNSFTASYGNSSDPMGAVELEVKKVSGSLMGAYGLIFCYQDFDNFYLLCIDVQGFYAIHKVASGSWTTISNWTYCEDLHKGYDSINTLRISYSRHTSSFSVYLNDALACTFVDTRFSGGYSGFFVDVLSGGYERFPEHPVDVRFKMTTNSGITVAPTSGLITTESGGSDTFTVMLNSQPSADVTIELWNSDPTEGAVSPSSLTFSPENWAIPQTVTVTGVDDSADDENRMYTILTVAAVSTDPAYHGVDGPDVSVTNRDNDPPIAPDDLNVNAVAGSQTILTWSDNSPNEEGFRIERRRGTLGSFVEIGTVPVDATAYTDVITDRAADSIYFYRICAYNQVGDSDYSKEASVQLEMQHNSEILAIDAGYAVIGAAEAVYIYRCIAGNNWDAGTKLLAPDAQAGDRFGCSVDLDEDYLVVGADGEDEGGSGAGAIYVFRRSGLGNWDFDTKLLAPDAGTSYGFGKSVATSGSYAIIGAGGAAYVFHRALDNTWDAGTKIPAPPRWTRGGFGRSVAIDGDYAVVGDETDYELDYSGAAFIFHRTGTNSWDEYAKVLSPDGEMNDFFGDAIAISGNYVVVGSENYYDPDYGAAYVFHRIGVNSWDAGTRIRAPDRYGYDLFGSAVAIEGDYMVVGARGANEGSTYAGAVYFFHRTGATSWSYTTKVYSTTGWHSYFGAAADTDGAHTIAGQGVYILY